MPTYLISYNLNEHDDDYDLVFAAIESLGDAWHDGTKLDSVWFVKTDLKPAAIRSALAKAFDRNDNCVIVDITDQPRDGWMPKAFWAWLRA